MANIRDAMARGASPDIALNRVSVARNGTYKANVSAAAGLADGLKQLYQSMQAERAEQEKKDVATGELLASSGAALPAEPNEAVKRGYDRTSFVRDTITPISAIAESYQSEEFLGLSKEDQDAALTQQKQELMLQMENAGLQDDEAVKQYLTKQFTALDQARAVAVQKHYTYTLPSRDVSATFDVERVSVTNPMGGSKEDLDRWQAVFATAQQKFKESGAGDEYARQVIYGEVSRMMDSKDLSAYNALRKSPLWNTLDTKQKNVLESNAYNLNLAFQKETEDGIVNGFKSFATTAVATGDVASVYQRYGEIQKGLTPQARSRIQGRLADTMQKFEDVTISLTRWKERKSDPTVTMTQEQVDTAFDVNMRQFVQNKEAYGGTVPAAQQAVIEMARAGAIPSQTKTAKLFSIANPTFVDGEAVGEAVEAVKGLDSLRNAVGSPAIMERIVGKENLEAYNIFDDYRRQGLDTNASLMAMRQQKEAELNKTEAQKFEKVLKSVGTLQSRNLLQRAVANATDVAKWGLERFNPVYAMLTRPEGIDAATDASRGMEVNFTDTSGARGVQAAWNRLQAGAQFSQFARNHAAYTEDQLASAWETKVKQDSLFVDGSLVMHDGLTSRIRQLAGNDPVAANAYTTEAIQVGALFAGLPDPQMAEEIMEYVSRTTVLEKATGEYFEMDAASAKRLVANGGFEIEKVVDTTKLSELIERGGTLPSGVKVPPLKDAVSDVAGVFDTTGDVPLKLRPLYFNEIGGERTAPVMTKTTYFPDTKQFRVDLLDAQGGNLFGQDTPYLTRDKDQRVLVGQGAGTFGAFNQQQFEQAEAVRKAGSIMYSTVPQEFVEAFVRGRMLDGTEMTERQAEAQ